VSDVLLSLSRHRQARQLVKTLGLPIPMPQNLRRADGPYVERPLADRTVVLGGLQGQGACAAVVAAAVIGSGANPLVVGEVPPVLNELGEAFGRPVRPLDPSAAMTDELRVDALVFDATDITTAAALPRLHAFFSPLLPKLGPCARVVVLGRPAAAAASAEAAAVAGALEGFVRSLAKEIGKRGSTAQLLVVEAGAEARAQAALRFFLSPHAAFITGQPLAITTSASGPSPNGHGWVRPLEGKVALVTGAGRGIGQATARRLAAEGAHVICLDRPADDGPVSQVARELGAAGSVLLADIADPAAPAAIASHIRQRHGGIDILVHNAGITRDKTLGRMKPETFAEVIEVNLGAILRLDGFLHDGLLREGGREICLSSVAGIAGNVGQTNYAASKAGVIAYVRHVAAGLAGRGITVNAVAPGFIETRLTAAIPLFIREAGRRLSALGQGGLPVDVAEAITFLATPGAVGVTGSVLRVCGGALIGA
jgi:3-oxoacyl-[acyl-carrier protein] reductase